MPRTADVPTTEAPTTGRGPGASGQYTIKQSNNDCDPSCAGGTATSKILRWNGSDYVG